MTDQPLTSEPNAASSTPADTVAAEGLEAGSSGLDLPGWLALTPAERATHRADAVARAQHIKTTHNAYISIAASPEQSRRDGAELGGIPFAVKDNIDIAGLETTCGGPLLAGTPAEVDADLVSLLRDAGAVLVGKTNLHELAFGATSNNATYGAVRNPYDPTRVAGGSSGGSAAAVALGSVPFSLGSDTGGSVTVPSAFCGIVGFRPTTGRYPGTGVANLSTSRDTIGLHARTVADVQYLDSVITRQRGPEMMRLDGLILGRVESRYEGAEAAVLDVIADALDQLRSAGARIVDVELPGDLDLAGGPGIELVFFETERLIPARHAGGRGAHAPFASLVEQCASPDVQGIARGIADAHVSPEAYELARRARWELRRRYDEAWRASGVDALVGPTVAVLPPHIGLDDSIEVDGRELPTFATLIRNAGPGTVAGNPMLTVPAGLSRSRLPVGLCLEGRPFADRAVLAMGATVQQALAQSAPRR